MVCKFNSAVYAMKSIKKHTAQRAGGVSDLPRFHDCLILGL